VVWRTNFPEYAANMRTKLKPFGVVPLFTDQSADGLSTLFAALDAHVGAAILSWRHRGNVAPLAGVASVLSALAMTVVVAGLPAVRPNPHAERFVKLLQEAARISPPPLSYGCTAVDKTGSVHRARDDRGFLLRVAVIVKNDVFPVTPGKLRWLPAHF